jgi:hypothetical protein
MCEHYQGTCRSYGASEYGGGQPINMPPMAAVEIQSASISTASPSDPVEVSVPAGILSRDKRSADHHRRHGNASVAGHDVSGRFARSAQRPGSHFRQNAQAFHSHRAGRQGFGGTVALRSDQSADYFSRAIRAVATGADSFRHPERSRLPRRSPASAGRSGRDPGAKPFRELLRDPSIPLARDSG